jgi:uncharacterized Zn finger protein
VDNEDEWYWDRFFSKFNFLIKYDCPDCGEEYNHLFGILSIGDETVYACKRCRSVYDEIDGKLRKKGAITDVIVDD